VICLGYKRYPIREYFANYYLPHVRWLLRFGQMRERGTSLCGERIVSERDTTYPNFER
jgi:hypothetical protein